MRLLLALTAAALTRGPLPFAASIAVAAVLTAILAAVIGAGALRVNGLLLAVVTFALGGAATQFIYRRTWLSNDQQSSVPFRRGTLFGLDLGSQRTFYYVVLAVLVVLLAVLSRVRSSGVGRSIIAVRDNPLSAAAFTVSPVRMRVFAFAVSGGIAGLGGAYFTLDAVGPFTKDMTAGAGYIALAAVIFGRWDPIKATLAALLFGFASNLQNTLGAINSPVPSEFMLMLPYIVTIFAVAGLVGQSRGPAASGKPYIKS